MSDSREVLRALGLLLATKTLLLALPHVLVLDDSAAVMTAVLSLLAIAGIRSRRSWGAAALVAAFILRIALTLPHTLNHAWFECLAAVVLWRAFSRGDLRTIVHGRCLLQFALLSVFFYSGVQKLVHGQFASGEYLLRTVALESSHMADVLTAGFGLVSALPSARASDLVLGPVPLDVTPQLHAGVRLLSLLIIAAELSVPVLVAARVRGSRWLLLATQVGIGLSSGEFDFAITATGLILLFWRKPPRIAWISAFVLWSGLLAASLSSG